MDAELIKHYENEVARKILAIDANNVVANEWLQVHKLRNNCRLFEKKEVGSVSTDY